MTVEWTSRAHHDLIQQLDFIARDKPSAADRMADLIDSSVKMLARWPQMGKAYGKDGIRLLTISRTPFLAVYRRRGSKIEVLRLLHGAQHRLS